jgi:hypothetical protein
VKVKSLKTPTTVCQKPDAGGTGARPAMAEKDRFVSAKYSRGSSINDIYM